MGQLVNLDLLPCREATFEERRKMLGSLATLYEMKQSLLHVTGTKLFYIIGYPDLDSSLYITEFSEDAELVILKTDVELPSIFRKWKKRPKLSKKWQ
jgi:hypothetical protein